MPLQLAPGTTLVAATHNPGNAKALVARPDGRYAAPPAVRAEAGRRTAPATPLQLAPGTTLVAATHNPGKAKELVALLDGRFEILSAGALNIPEPDETESTFVGNALLKARHAADLSG